MAPDLILPSGVLSLDRILNGGLHTGMITHVYGEAASGKTTMGLQFVSSACRLGARVMYINSESASPIERLEQITSRKFKEIEDMVRILAPRGFTEQGALIDDLELYAREGTRLAVIDTLTRLYRTVLEDKDATYEAHRELNRQTGFLKGLAKQRNMAVLILNQVRGVPEARDTFEPVAKNILDYWADCVLCLHLGRERGERIIELIRPEEERQKATLYITHAGLAPEPESKETVKWPSDTTVRRGTLDV